MDDTQRRVDAIRKDSTELENHIIDEYAAGKITRREFVRRGTVIGMSIPLVSFLAAACGGGGGGETTGGGTSAHGHGRGAGGGQHPRGYHPTRDRAESDHRQRRGRSRAARLDR